MAKVSKAGQVGSRMSEAEKAKANAARLAKAAKIAAKMANKSKTAKKAKSVFKAVQAKKIALTVFVGIIPTDLVEPTWDNAQSFIVEKPRAVKKVAPSVKAKKAVVVSSNTGTKADKFAPSPVKVVEPIINSVIDDSNKALKDALRKVMYDSFYNEQKEAVADLIFARKNEVHAAYVAQYEAYKQELKSVISVVTDEFESIKVQVNEDLNAWADQEVKQYEQQLAKDFVEAKPTLLQEVLDEAQLPIDVATVNALIDQAKSQEEVAKVNAVKEQSAKKLAAIDLYNKQQKQQAVNTSVTKDKNALAKAKNELFYSNKVTTAMACKAVINNSVEVTKVNKEQAKQYLELFLELQALIKQAQAAYGTAEFKNLLNRIYKVGGALSALFKSISNDLGYSFNDAVENILNDNLQAINSIEAVMSLTNTQKNNRKVILDVLEKLEALS